MALPTYQALNNATSGAGALVKAWPVHIADDVALLVVQSSNEAITLSTDAGFVEIGTQEGVGTAAAAGATRIAVYWCRATSDAMGSPTIADAGNHVVATMITFRGCITTGDPYEVTDIDTAAATTAVSVPGGTTTLNDCLIVAIACHGIDSAAAQFSNWANASLTDVTERADAGGIANNGGGIGIAVGGLATAGTFDATTATIATANLAMRSVALKSPSVAAVTGDAALTLGAVTISADGDVTGGVSNLTLGAVTISADGDVTGDVGSASMTLGAVTISSEGTVGPPTPGTNGADGAAGYIYSMPI